MGAFSCVLAFMCGCPPSVCGICFRARVLYRGLVAFEVPPQWKVPCGLYWLGFRRLMDFGGVSLFVPELVCVLARAPSVGSSEVIQTFSVLGKLRYVLGGSPYCAP